MQSATVSRWNQLGARKRSYRFPMAVMVTVKKGQ
ncbi:hypothetical protein FHS26_001228 [Rhizobium pisi]|uniref:Uncharacterized protein n=1 Tax=Rhizobium pisi TaxID=574561 RepID=A0A7W5BIR7_9HYPH|nr:hypothetical protein [Rhizobium pisi]